ncbi:MAG: type II toxin-antitoxin system RelE/ParE family toxin [Dehalococcoidia bacterium]
MSSVSLSAPARRDIDDIIDYIATDSPRAAERVRVQLQATCELLAATPQAGRRRDELGSGIRSFPVGSYVIFYRPIDGGVEIIRVLHGRRDINAIDWE